MRHQGKAKEGRLGRKIHAKNIGNLDALALATKRKSLTIQGDFGTIALFEGLNYV